MKPHSQTLRHAENDHIGAVDQLNVGGGGEQGEEGGAACHPRGGENGEHNHHKQSGFWEK